jgi:hypothetical protein
MSQTRRLGQLNAAESWLNNYRYLVNADFKAYDFESLRTALLNQIQTNYPEDFNDFINTSEYVALIDLIAFLGQNLTFRGDLNLRETFLETAEVRGNVLSIARQLGYKPFRNLNAGGFLRISAMKTSQNITDTKGTNLANKIVVWGDPLNPDFSEQFNVILNQAFSKGNPIGRPIATEISNGTLRELYQIDQSTNRTMVESFNLTARNSTNYSCEIVPITLDAATQLAIESVPNPYGYMTMLFNNDGTGYANLTNGWFLLFKQGTLKFQDYVLTTSIENRVIDIADTGINESDVWVQSIDGNGQIIDTWTAVPSTVGKNIAFNAVDKNTRKIYEVITRENDTISIKFGDGTFSDIPTGNIRIWYRQSATESVKFTPNDVSGMQLTLRYVDGTGVEQDLTCTMQLTDSISNTTSETLTQIKNRAARTASTQNRMITASDYNIYPEGQIGGVDKILSINRTFAGQSIYADIQDPTATYRPVITIASDGFLYTTENTVEDTLIDSSTLAEVVNWIQDALLNRNTLQLYYKAYTNDVSGNIRIPAQPNTNPESTLVWHKVGYSAGTTHGYFYQYGDAEKKPVRLGSGTAVLDNRSLKKNSLVNFNNNITPWAKVLDVYREGFGVGDSNGKNTGLRANGQGAVFLDGTVNDGLVNGWVPAMRTILTVAESEELLNKVKAKQNFALRYDNRRDRWYIIPADQIDTTVGQKLNLTTAGTTTDSSWLIRVAHNSTTKIWASVLRRDQTVFGSEKELTFFNQRFGIALDQTTRRIIKDSVKFLAVNEGLGNNELSLDVVDYFRLDDGRYDSTRVQVLLPGLVDTLVPKDPTVIDTVIQTGTNNTSAHIVNLNKVEFSDTLGQYTLKPTVSTSQGPVAGDINNVKGRQSLKVQYNHVPLRDNRVDPTTTNIIDMFVLTTDFNTAFRAWINNGAISNRRPLPLTSYSLEKLMQPIIPYKSVSDTIVFHPVGYKVIFGTGSDARYQVTIRVTKSDGTKVSDAEIRSKVITSINAYFDISNWDFGETFYFTDMASWVHKQLGGVISSIVLIPLQSNLTSNDMFQIKCEQNEIFISSATVNNVEIISSQVAPTLTGIQ